MNVVRVCGTMICLLLMMAGSVWGAEAARITQLATKVHVDLNRLVKVKKLARPAAVKQQRAFLLRQPEVKAVQRLKGNNLMVRFKDGNELLMFLGEDRLGSTDNRAPLPATKRIVESTRPTAVRQIKPTAVKPKKPVIVGQLKPPVLVMKPCAPNSNKALIFDCLEDDYNVASPKVWRQVRADLLSLGYTVTLKLNNNANLANAALIDDGEYGVVVMRGHGGDLGGDFGFLVRPWYDSYPSSNSGYTGTIRASAYNHAAGATQFGYIITGSFSSTYWTNKAFPSTLFFLESCHGADPGALPGMPTWTTEHGASAWLGWNDSVSFNCGDNGTTLFFQKFKEQEKVGAAVDAVYATGCRPPELVCFPDNKRRCRSAVWKYDVNEGSVANGRDFKKLRLVSGNGYLHADIEFWAAPTFSEFFFYVDIGGTSAADVLIKCHQSDFAVYQQSTPGLFNNKVFTGRATKSGTRYTIAVPWNKSFGTANPVKVWLYDMAVKDRLPNSSSVRVVK